MYIDKSAWDSKKFKGYLAGILSIVFTAVLAPRLGPVTGIVTDYLANNVAELLLTFLTAVYIYVQGRIDHAMASPPSA